VRLPRRPFLGLVANAVALRALSGLAWAETYPSRPVHLVEGYGAGSAPDIIARLIGQWLWERLGRPFVIENRAGASGRIAAEAVARASPDGYTLLLVLTNNAIDAAFKDKLNYDFIRDIAPVASLYRTPLVMEVHPSVPANTVAEFIAYAKTRPGKINMGSAGTGTGTHIAGELFQMMTGVNLFHIPYRGVQVLRDLVGGQVQIYFGPIASSLAQIKAGKLRALAVTTATRSDVLPDIPSLGEFLPGYEYSAWYGIGAPRGTPAEIVERLNKEVNAALVDQRFKGQVAELGGTPLPGSPADFVKLIATDTEKVGKVVQVANITVE
jgi:tripartite-type tricarboxylate transporter receptor subunit TctC